MRAWLGHHAACFTSTLRRIAGAPLGSLANILVIGLTATLPLLGLLAIENGKALAGRITVEPTLGVFFALDAGKPEIAAVESALREVAGVRAVQFISREDALTRLRQSEGLRDALGALRSNPLPDALVAILDPRMEQAEQSLLDRVRAMPKVAHVQLDAAWIQRLRAMLELGSAGLTLLAALLGAVFVAVTFNTVRVQVNGQAEELAVARLVGATNAYLRRPFYHFGMLLGLFGGLVAVGLAWAALAYLDDSVVNLAREYGSGFRLIFVTPAQLGAVLVVSSLLGLIGAFLAVSIYLHSISDPA